MQLSNTVMQLSNTIVSDITAKQAVEELRKHGLDVEVENNEKIKILGGVPPKVDYWWDKWFYIWESSPGQWICHVVDQSEIKYCTLRVGVNHVKSKLKP